MTEPINSNDIFFQFEAIFKFATEGIIITDDKSTILKVNPSGLSLFGYQNEAEIVNQKIEKLIPARFKHNHENHRNQFAAKPKARSMGSNMDLAALRKDSSEFPVEISLSPFKSNNNNYFICFVIDITNRKAIELREKNYRNELEQEVEERTLILKEAIQNLEKTKVDLDESLKREQELNLIKTKFISIASHEFRTPLSTILSSLSLVEKYAKLEEPIKRDKHIDRIKKSIKHLTEMLNDILSVNKIEEGMVNILAVEFELYGFIEDIIHELSGLLKTNQTILKNFDLSQKLEIYQDAKILRAIIINLISNAIKFSKENTQIEINIELNNELIEISIQDQGIGIPDADQKKLFTRFFRSTNVDNIQGTGLGLSIVNQYLNYIGGNINFESEVNVGSKFRIEIPRFLPDLPLT